MRRAAQPRPSNGLSAARDWKVDELGTRWAHPAMAAQFTEAELKLLQALVYQECGMHFDERRTHFLQDRLQRRLKECHLDSFYSYYRLLISKEGKTGTGPAAGKSDRQRDQLLPQQGAAGTVSQTHSRRTDSPQAGAAGLLVAHLERGLLHRPGALHPGHAGRRQPGLLLSAQSAVGRHAVAQAVDSSALEGRDHRQRHQLLGAARGPGRHLLRNSDGERGLQLPACATSTKSASATPSRKR